LATVWCSRLKFNRRFGGRCRLHLHGRRLSSACHLLSRWFLAWLILRSWICRRYFPPKRRLTFNGLHGVISQKIVVLLTINSICKGISIDLVIIFVSCRFPLQYTCLRLHWK
jgi:hypothetical protein